MADRQVPILGCECTTCEQLRTKISTTHYWLCCGSQIYAEHHGSPADCSHPERRRWIPVPNPGPFTYKVGYPVVSLTAVLPTDHAARNEIPMCTGFIDYFPLAVAEVAKLSKAANEQHNPGQPMHWARGKSLDHRDKILKHLTDSGTFDADGQRHSTKVAWRAMALLQTELEEAGGTPGRASVFPPK